MLNSHLPRPWNVADPRDVEAAHQIDALANRFFIDPLALGTYPADLIACHARHHATGRFVHDGDLDAIKGTLDVIGVNYYSSHIVRHHDGPRHDTGEDGHKATTLQLLAGRGSTWSSCRSSASAPRWAGTWTPAASTRT